MQVLHTTLIMVLLKLLQFRPFCEQNGCIKKELLVEDGINYKPKKPSE